MLALVLPPVRAIDGVIDAEGEFTYAIDDTKLPMPRTPVLAAGRVDRQSPTFRRRADHPYRGRRCRVAYLPRT